MFKDKVIPNIAKVSREFTYATHKNKTKMKHEHTKCYSTRDITTAWSCRGRFSTINTCRKDKDTMQHMQLCEKHTNMTQKSSKNHKKITKQ